MEIGCCHDDDLDLYPLSVLSLATYFCNEVMTNINTMRFRIANRHHETSIGAIRTYKYNHDLLRPMSIDFA